MYQIQIGEVTVHGVDLPVYLFEARPGGQLAIQVGVEEGSVYTQLQDFCREWEQQFSPAEVGSGCKA